MNAKFWPMVLVILTLVATGCAPNSLLLQMHAKEVELSRLETGRSSDVKILDSPRYLALQLLIGRAEEESSVFEADTVVAFYYQDAATSIVYASVWSNTGTMDCISSRPFSLASTHLYHGPPRYSDEIIRLVLRGEFATIEEVSKSTQGVVAPAQLVTAYRLVKNGESWDVAIGRFTEFVEGFRRSP